MLGRLPTAHLFGELAARKIIDPGRGFQDRRRQIEQLGQGPITTDVGEAGADLLKIDQPTFLPHHPMVDPRSTHIDRADGERHQSMSVSHLISINIVEKSQPSPFATS